MRLVRRSMAATVSLLFVLVALAPRAAAHSVSGEGATNFVTTLGGVAPATPGVELDVIEAGSRLQLTNHSGEDIVVVGYTDEPYLRVGPDGVYVNTRSPAAYLNASRSGGTPIPPDADPTAPPVWRRVSSGQVARWHDHRTHWMGGQLPPQVRQHPERRQTVFPWKVDLRQGDRAITAQGTLDWVPGPSPVPWLALAAVAGVLAAAVAWRVRARRLVAGLLTVAVAADVVHAAGLYAVIAGPVSTRLLKTLTANLFSVAAWVVAAVAVTLLLRGRAGGRHLALFSALVIGVAGGLLDVAYLGRTTLPFGFAPWLGRSVVALSVGVGLGLAAGLLMVLVSPDAVGGRAAGSPVGELPARHGADAAGPPPAERLRE